MIKVEGTIVKIQGKEGELAEEFARIILALEKMGPKILDRSQIILDAIDKGEAGYIAVNRKVGKYYEC